MANVTQGKPYASFPAITGSSSVGLSGKIIVGAHNLHTAAQTATILLTDANGTVIGNIAALGVGAFWTPPSPGITSPSGSFTAAPSTTVTGAGVIIFYQPSA